MAVEITVMVLVGSAIGVLPTILLLIAASMIGGWLLRREGTRALGAFREAALARKPPHEEMVNGVLIAAAAVLIVLPGFVSDVLALFLLFPPTRALVARRWVRRAEARTTTTYVDGEVVPDEPKPYIVIPEARREA
jgi:UPF0716 protein FxsA